MRSTLLHLAAAMAMGASASAQPLPTPHQAVEPAPMQNAAPLTLEQAVKRALDNNHALSAARHTAQSADGVVQQARSRPNPVLDIEVEDTSQKASRTTTTTLSLPIELGGKRDARIDAASLTRDIARQEAEQARADVRSQAVAAFFEVLIAQERVALSDKAVGIARDAQRIAAKRVEAGKVAPLDADRAHVELANAELEAEQARNALQAARRGLSTLWGESKPTFTSAEGEIDAPLSRPDLDDLASALETSPLLHAARLASDRSQAQLAVEKSKRYPDLEVSAGVARNNELGRNQVLVGVSIPLPLFDRNQGNVYEASMLVYKSRDDYLGLKTQLQAQLQRAASEFDLAKSAVRRLEAEILPSANTAFDRAKRGFEAGKFDFTVVLDAQRTLFQATARHLSALSDAYQALAHIDRILGRKS